MMMSSEEEKKIVTTVGRHPCKYSTVNSKFPRAEIYHRQFQNVYRSLSLKVP